MCLDFNLLKFESMVASFTLHPVIARKPHVGCTVRHGCNAIWQKYRCQPDNSTSVQATVKKERGKQLSAQRCYLALRLAIVRCID